MACVRNHTCVPHGKAEHGGVGGEPRCKLEGVSVEESDLVGGEQLLGQEKAKGSGLADRAGTGANLNVILETLNQKIQSKRLLRPGGRLKSMGFE